MPSGAKKRKAAKKKQVHNSSSTNPHQGPKKRKPAKKNQVYNSSSTNPHQGENDGGELSSPTSQDNQNPSVEAVTKGGDSSVNKSKDDTNIEIETGSKSKSSSSSGSDSSDDDSNEKKEAVPESVPEIESSTEIITDKSLELENPTVVDETNNEDATDKVEEVEVSAIVEPVSSVDSSLQEVVKVYDETKDEERKELVVPEIPEVVETEVVVKDGTPEVVEEVVVESVSKESGVVDLSTPPVHADETETVEHSDRQSSVGSPPITVQKTTSWKTCCGMLELFSGSAR